MLRKLMIAAVAIATVMVFHCPEDCTYAAEPVTTLQQASGGPTMAPPSQSSTGEPVALYGVNERVSVRSQEGGMNCRESWVRVVWRYLGEIMTGWRLAVVCDY